MNYLGNPNPPRRKKVKIRGIAMSLTIPAYELSKQEINTAIRNRELVYIIGIGEYSGLSLKCEAIGMETLSSGTIVATGKGYVI